MAWKIIENLTIGRRIDAVGPKEPSMTPWNHPWLQKWSLMDPKTLKINPQGSRNGPPNPQDLPKLTLGTPQNRKMDPYRGQMTT